MLFVFSPLIKTAEVLRSAGEGAWSGLFQGNRLIKENRELKRRMAKLQLEKAGLESRLSTLEKELSLESAAFSGDVDKYTLLPVRISAWSPHPWRKSILINRGSNHGVKKEQAVINDKGLVGVVTTVSKSISSVNLLIDRSSALVVRLEETGELGAVEGKGSGEIIEMETEGLSGRIRREMSVVTAGLERSVFPPGLPVGKVNSIERDKFGLTRIKLSPAADFNNLDILFVLIGSEGPEEMRRFEDY